MMKRKRSIEWLKCIAAIIIVNSHCSSLYPDQVSFLSFGGFLGNCLFFSLSGYCLAKNTQTFGKFIFKRYIRVYMPYLVIISFSILSGVSKFDSVFDILIPIKGYHFLVTILLLYPLYWGVGYIVRNSKLNYGLFFAIIVLIQGGYFLLCFDLYNGNVIQNFTPMSISSYFLCMLLGAYMNGRKYDKTLLYAVLIALSFFAYGIQGKISLIGIFKIFQIYIAFVFIYNMFSFFISIEKKLPSSKIVSVISNITLEMYIVQFVEIYAHESLRFPTNLIYCYISVIAIAYCFHIVIDKLFEKGERIVKCLGEKLR